MNHFMGKVIWVTGASSGIGEALVKALDYSRSKLIISARRESELERVKNSCSKDDRIRILPFDLKSTESFKDIVTKAISFWGHIDVIIMNGGIAQRSLAKYTTLEVDREIMEVDYFSCVALSKHITPHFTERNSGHLVVVSSVMGFIGTPFRSGYAAAKHALHGYFDSLRAELWKKSKGVSVTLIAPGWVRTNITYNALNGDGSKINSMDNATAKGMDPDIFASKMLRAIRKKKNTAVIGGGAARSDVTRLGSKWWSTS
ncbi:MAG: SDR family NAD(P)-dependent oxidoreductase, partial [Cyclobacteriaceae bacterium]